MRIVAKTEEDKVLPKQFLKPFYYHIAMFEPLLRTDTFFLELSDKNETEVQEREARVKININDTIFQDKEVINPFICQEIIRIKIKQQISLPKIVEDIVCGRETAKIYTNVYFQLCYLEMLKRKKIKFLEDFLQINKHWVIFHPLDSYNSEFLKNLANRTTHEKKADILSIPFFNATKNELSSNEKLNNAIEAYENLISDYYAGS